MLIVGSSNREGREMIFKVTFVDGSVETVHASSSAEARRFAIQEFRGRIVVKATSGINRHGESAPTNAKNAAPRKLGHHRKAPEVERIMPRLPEASTVREYALAVRLTAVLGFRQSCSRS